MHSNKYIFLIAIHYKNEILKLTLYYFLQILITMLILKYKQIIL